MTTLPLRRFTLARAVVHLVFVGLSATWGTGQIVQAQEQELFLGIVNDSGSPIMDIKAGEIFVQWDGENCETLDLTRHNWPIRVTVFVDNSYHTVSGLQDLREGLLAFVSELPDDVEVGLATTTNRPRWVLEHTLDRDDLTRRINLISPQTGGASFRDALVEEAGRLNGDDDREYYPVIVMVSGDGPEVSTSQEGRVEEMIRQMILNSAEVHTLAWGRGMTNRNGALQARLGEILAEQTRGSLDYFIDSVDLVNKLPELGRDLANKHLLVSNQYRVSYRPPPNPSAQPAVGVLIGRAGVNSILTLDGNVPARMSQP